uniref:PGG domain-containing protein n=1 Tax=Leersia perrieri TaxID=77586 RepID=A0A0D9XCP0_9ORYZ
MATRNVEEPPSSSMAANAPPVSAAAILMVATDGGECQQLEDVIAKEDTTTMLVTMAASAAAMALKNGEEERPSPSIGAMDTKVLIARSPGDCELLKDALNKEDALHAETMLVVMASKKQDIVKQSTATMNPQLENYSPDVLERESTSNGSITTQNDHLVHHEDSVQQMAQQASSGAAAEEEEGDSNHSPSLLRQDLEGVTVEGNTALHVVAACGDDDSYLSCANKIYEHAPHLLLEQNNNGDTPLHCAVKAGKSEMVYRLIDLAQREDSSASSSSSSSRLKELLRKENYSKETALHDAIRTGNKGVLEKLLELDSELARFPMDGTGTSPLYIAVFLNRLDIAKTLLVKSNGNLSYSGPEGQNALYAAVCCGKVMTEMLLPYNKSLMKQADQYGTTPLHFAASFLLRESVFYFAVSFLWRGSTERWMSSSSVIPLLEGNQIQLYQPNYKGYYPIHVAASSGAVETVRYFIRKWPGIAGLRDCKGRTFLHVAVEWGKYSIVRNTRLTPSMARILNMQDNDGNTAMHIVVQNGNKSIFCTLLCSRNINLDILNKKGQTPLDIAYSKIPAEFLYGWNPETLILRALILCNASFGCRRQFPFQKQDIPQQHKADEEKESQKLTNSTQILGIGSVLIVTVTFGAMFAIPGGYKADDHYNGGTPTLAGRYIFDAFIMANVIAFICSVLATINLMYSGMPMVVLPLRRRHFNISIFLAVSSVTSLAAAFALGMYLVLAPVARMTGVAICVMMMIASICIFTEPLHALSLANALFVRMGNRAFPIIVRVFLRKILVTCWPCVIIFGWAAISTNSSTPPPIAPKPKLTVATNHGEICQQLKDLIKKEDTTTMVVALVSSSKEATAAAMAFKINGEEGGSRGDRDANKVMIETSPGDCDLTKDTLKKEDVATMFSDVLKDTLNKEHAATTTMLVMVSKTKDIAKPTASMNPLLLSLASRGDCDGLNDYIMNIVPTDPDGGKGGSPGDGSNTAITTTQQQADSADQSGRWRLGLDGVTVEGDKALHVVASCGDGTNYLRSASIIYRKAQHLLLAQNNKGDTPLHCAVRARRAQMVSCLIDLAKTEDNSGSSSRLKELLRKENYSKEAALQEAVRIGNKGIITKLLEYDSELARFPMDGTGKTVKMLLNWNKDLTKQADQNGSTPLHFAASLRSRSVKLWIDFAASLRSRSVKLWMSHSPLIPVLEANPTQMYQPDYEGLYPIHVAASSGAKQAIMFFIKERPEIAGFRDSKGRTFLHVAAVRDMSPIVKYVCRTPSLAWILNLQDNDGNTTMHVALQHVAIYNFCALLRNREVNLNIPNNKGQTPLAALLSNIPAGISYMWNPETMMFGALKVCNASMGCREDHFQELKQKESDEATQSEKMTNSTQTLSIAAVLIVTVTFGSIFAIPGGYIADDNYNGGTPTFARKHMFGAFILANTIAFILSGLATISLMYSGVPMVSLPLRLEHFNKSVFLAMGSVASLGVTFTLGMCLVLAPVARWTATAICVMMVIAGLYSIGVALHWHHTVPIYLAIRARRKYMKNMNTNDSLISH